MFMHLAKSFQNATEITAAAPAVRSFTAGLLAGTRIETELGWRGVETLRRGDRVHTHDGGLQEVLLIDRHWIFPGTGAGLIRLRGGSFGACADLTLMPGQHLLFATPHRRATPEAAHVLIPAAALEGVRGAAARPILRAIEVVTPFFESEEIIYANTGVRLYCPRLGETPGGAPQTEYFTVLAKAEARAMLARIVGRETRIEQMARRRPARAA